MVSTLRSWEQRQEIAKQVQPSKEKGNDKCLSKFSKAKNSCFIKQFERESRIRKNDPTISRLTLEKVTDFEWHKCETHVSNQRKETFFEFYKAFNVNCNTLRPHQINFNRNSINNNQTSRVSLISSKPKGLIHNKRNIAAE